MRENPPAPEAFGLNPKTTRLQALTEFVESPPPVKLAGWAGELADQRLEFGGLSIGAGKAFSVEAAGDPTGAVPVGKEWGQIEGRTFLVEEAPYARVRSQLQRLPPAKPYEGASLQRRGEGKNALAGLRNLIPKRYAKTSVPAPDRPKLMARVTSNPGAGFVLDYVTVIAQTNHTFKGDTTYFINGIVQLSELTTFEGGAVLKYATNGAIRLEGGALGPNVNVTACATAPYRPVVLTSKDDNSVGETISGSTGNPIHRLANPALHFYYASTEGLRNFRIAHAKLGVKIESDVNEYRLGDFQIRDSGIAFELHSAVLRLQNGLVSGIAETCFTGNYSGVNLEHVTVHNVGKLAELADCYAELGYGLTNCLLVGITNWGNVGFATNATEVTALQTVFQTVGGGAHYLATNSPYRNVGTTNMDAALLAGLRTKTTYPPLAYTNVTFTTSQTFPPQAQRDTDTPDLGYHYEPLDYSLGGCAASANLTFTPGTAVGWFRTTSGWYHAGQAIRMIGNIVVSFDGTVTAPTYFVRLSTVQENDRTAGFGHGGIENWEGPAIPTVRGRFLRCTAMTGEVFNGYFADDYGLIRAEMTHSEFWSGALNNYGDYMRYTNCLMWRLGLGIANGATGRDHILRNCTMIGGTLGMSRQPWYGPSPVSIRDCSFDGTVIAVNDYYGSNPTYTDYDHNAYTNTSNPFPIGGINDQRGVTFNWQTHWLGNYYLPGDSPLLNAGSRTADAVGLFHFTTQTDQTKEGISAVDIGYHYLGVDWEGKPWDENWDEVPDYVADPDGDGLDDAWELLHFGDLSETGSLDYDGDGATNLDEFNAPTDPNTIAFTTRFDNLYVSNRVVAGTCELQTGHPHEMAVLINSNNFAGASWTAYNSNLSFTLPDADGDYLVLVALRGLVATNPPVTDYTELTLDRVPPLLVITNPVLTGAAATVVKPYLQLQGYADEPLGRYSYDLTNELGLVTNELVAVVDQYFDTNRFDFTTNYFQAYDIELATNVNTIILRVADRAGNVTETNLVVTLDFTGDTNAPGLSLIWPTNDMHLSGDSFYLRGKIDDETASLTARIVNANGATNEAVGLVERNGMFWLEDLPLAAGTNTIELTATDAAGNVNTTSFNVVQSGVTLTIDSTPTGAALYELTGTVYGTVSDPSYAVTVNGVAATVDGGGNWLAEGVPNYGQGTSTFDAQATASGNPSVQVSRQEEQDPEVFVTEHHSSWAVHEPGRGEHWTHAYSAQFEPDENGNRRLKYTGTATRRVTTEACAYTHTYRWSSSNDVLTVQQEGCGGDSEPTPVSSGSEFYWVKDAIGKSYDHSDSWTLGHSTHFVVHYFAKEVQHEFPNGDGTVTTVTVPAAYTQWKLFTGGKASVQKKNLFCLNASATEYNGRPQRAPWYCTPSDPVAASRIRVNGERVGNDRLLYKMYPDNEPVTVTVQVEDAKHYDASVGASKHRLRIVVNGSCPLEENKVVSCAKYCVGQKLEFSPYWVPSIPGVASTTAAWNFGGNFVNDSWQHSYVVINPPSPPVNVPYGSVNYFKNLERLNEESTFAWWSSGGHEPPETYHARLGEHLTFNNGQQITVVAKGLLAMHRPRGKIVVKHRYGTPTFFFVKPWSWSGGGEIQVGDLLSNNMMQFDAGIESRVAGKGKWVQLLEFFDATGSGWLDGIPVINPSLSNVLDNQDPYMGERDVVPYQPASESQVPFLDAPHASQSAGVIALEARFRDYLMFKPNSADSIWVPLGNTAWSARGLAVKPSLDIDPNEVNGPENLNDAADFPIWMSVFSTPE